MLCLVSIVLRCMMRGRVILRLFICSRVLGLRRVWRCRFVLVLLILWFECMLILLLLVRVSFLVLLCVCRSRLCVLMRLLIFVLGLACPGLSIFLFRLLWCVSSRLVGLLMRRLGELACDSGVVAGVVVGGGVGFGGAVGVLVSGVCGFGLCVDCVVVVVG